VYLLEGEMTDQASSSQNKYALLIGIDCYLPGRLADGSYYPSLGGCVRDIAHVEDFLRNKLRFTDEQIHKLTATNTGGTEPAEPRDQWPTYENMVAALERLIDKAQRGDLVYIHYSGHGGEAMPTLAPEKKGPKGIDEALVPTDIHNPRARYLRDLELALTFQRMARKGLRLSVVLDSCHSGGAVRGLGDVAVRGIGVVDKTPRPQESLVASPKELGEAWDSLTRGGTRSVSLGSGWLPEPEGYVLLAACRPTESAYEYAFSPNERNGALTYWLLDSLNKYGANLSAKTIHERIVAKVHSQFVEQTPQLQGEGQNPLFGGDPGNVVTTATVEEVDAADRRVRLGSVGQAFGNRKGAQFAIYPFGTTDFTDALKRLAIVTVTQIGAVDSQAEITASLSDAPIEQGAPAVLLDQGSLKLLHKVSLTVRDPATDPTADEEAPPVEGQEPLLEAVRQAMNGNLWVAEWKKGEGDTLEYQVVVNKAGQYELWDPAGKRISLRPSVRVDAPRAANTVVDRLVHLAKYDAAKRLENHDPQSPLRGKLVVELKGWQDDYTPGDPPDPQPFDDPGNTPAVKPGQWVFLRIRNEASGPLNVTVLDFQPDWGVSQIFPKGEGNLFVQIRPDQEELLPLQASLPQGYEDGLDVLKVFGTLGTANFARLVLPALDQPVVRAAVKRASAMCGQPNPLEDLMDAISGDQPPKTSTRTFTAAAFPSREWTSSSIELRVKKA
jgi:hypothetical protein